MAVSTSDNILNADKINRALTRIAHEILEHNSGAKTLGLIGILTRGAVLAQRIASIIHKLEGVKVPVGLMDINLYRDDLRTKRDQPLIQRTEVLFEVSDRNIVLVDDVLFTGRTIRAALDQIIDFGRPRTIQLAVLVDRGHRELPIKADYVGANIPTAKTDQVIVEVAEKDGTDAVRVSRDGKKPAKSGAGTAAKARKGGKK